MTGNPSWTQSDLDALDCFFADPAAQTEFQGAVRATEDAAGTADLLASMFTEGMPRDELLWVAGENLKLPRRHASDLLFHHAIIDWRYLILTIRLPTLVIGGEASFFLPQTQRWIAEQIPGADCVIFGAEEGGSHFMFWENPAKFNAAVGAFLDR